MNPTEGELSTNKMEFHNDYKNKSHKKLFQKLKENVYHLNKNINNSGGQDLEISDWEDFNLVENDDLEQVENEVPLNNEENDQGNIKFRENVPFPENNPDCENFELVVSDDEEGEGNNENKSNKCNSELCHNSLLFNINSIDNRNSTRCIIGQLSEFTRYFFSLMSLIFSLVIFMIILPFKLACKLSCFLKRYTNSSTIFVVPFKIFPVLIMKTFAYIKTKFQKSEVSEKECRNKKTSQRLSRSNSNNNAVVESKEDGSNILFCIYIFCITMMIGGLFVHCWFIPDSSICSVNSVIHTLKTKFIKIFHEIYILPGDDCMKAGRCCKGFMEATFRWINCFLTLPIRSTLTAWPRQVQEKEVISDNTDDIKFRVEKIIQEFKEAKDRTNNQEELLLKLRHQFNILEKQIEEKSKDISKLEPLLKILSQSVQQMSQNVTFGMNQMQNIVSIKQESDKIIDTMKTIARETSNSAKATMSKMQNQIEAEQHRLISRIEMLEALINEGESRGTDSTIQMLNKVKDELDMIKLSQEEMRLRLISLKDIPKKYNKMSQKLKADVKTKLTEELEDHDRMTKKTECYCMKQINNFKEEFDKSKSQFSCFIEALVDKQANIVLTKLKGEIATTFYDRTAEISKNIAEEALSRYSKGETSTQQSVKGGGFFTELKKIEPVPFVCHRNNTEQFLNMSAFCLNNESLKKVLNKSQECLSNKQIKQMIKMAMAKYSADKIGLADFALESMGGSVIASRSSPTYSGHKGLFSFFSMSLFKTFNSLRTIIQPGNQPGDCWAFPGSVGHTVVQLSHTILVNAVSLEHLPAQLNPDGQILSAPKKFQIYALSEISIDRKELLGTYEYVNDNQAIQTFLVETPQVAKIIQMNVLSNHGHKEYTCIYRLRIHGSLYNSTSAF